MENGERRSFFWRDTEAKARAGEAARAEENSSSIHLDNDEKSGGEKNRTLSKKPKECGTH
jgi:hypothetical protein